MCMDIFYDTRSYMKFFICINQEGADKNRPLDIFWLGFRLTLGLSRCGELFSALRVLDEQMEEASVQNH